LHSETVLAIDLGGTKVASALVDRRGRITSPKSESTDCSSNTSVIKQLQRVARRVRGRVAAVGVCVPGLARKDGTVWAPNLPGWTRQPLRRELERVAGVPVAVDSDRNCAVLGEAWMGAARGCADVVCLIVGTGIGAGILSDGRLIRGPDELSGCAGWLAISEDLKAEYRRCGILESLAAGPAIARFAGVASVQQLSSAARRGDPHARQALIEAGRRLGLGVANIISLLNPHVVVIGGGVAAAGEILFGALRRTALAWTQPLAARRVRIVRSRLAGRAPLLGAARVALEMK